VERACRNDIPGLENKQPFRQMAAIRPTIIYDVHRFSEKIMREQGTA
jgi:hypothetical protein